MCTLRFCRAGPLLALATFGLQTAGPAGAQNSQGTGVVSLGQIWDGIDGLELTPEGAQKFRDAASRAKPAGDCPRAKVTVFAIQGDNIFQEARTVARSYALRSLLGDDARYFLFEGNWHGTHEDVRIDYDGVRDREPPRLRITSVPPQGTRVRPGQQITVTMEARDDANTWQTGVESLQLVAQAEGGDVLVGAQSYPPIPRPDCKGAPAPRRLVLTYTVPPDPPLVVRLRAIAQDFANLSDFEVGEFPTGEWYGRLTYSLKPQPSAYAVDVHGEMDLSLMSDGQGGLTGSIVGTQFQQMEVPKGPLAPRCAVSVTPGTFHGKLIGSYTPGHDTMSIEITDAEYTPGEITPCPPAPSVTVQAQAPNAYPTLRDALRGLRRQSNGNFIGAVEREVSSGQTRLIHKFTVTIQRAAD